MDTITITSALDFLGISCDERHDGIRIGGLTLYLDTKDPENKGWAYGLVTDDDTESGPLDNLGDVIAIVRRVVFVPGAEVEAGAPGTEDYDVGAIRELDGERALVGWRTGVATWTPIADLRVA